LFFECHAFQLLPHGGNFHRTYLHFCPTLDHVIRFLIPCSLYLLVVCLQIVPWTL
jgi:hypothetical protein